MGSFQVESEARLHFLDGHCVSIHCSLFKSGKNKKKYAMAPAGLVLGYDYHLIPECLM